MRRFLNADSITSTGQGILGNNMFAYCNNNPVNMVDCCGNMPGDLFESPDEAALDFAMCYNGLSIAEGQEFGSAIYEVEQVQIRWFWHSKKVNYGWFSLTLYSLERITTKDYKYSYTEPNVGKNGDSVIPNFATVHKIVSTVHTHGKFHPKYDNEAFSEYDEWWKMGDIEWANLAKMNIYVATPGGRLKKYTYSDRNKPNCGVTTISTAIPWDPDCPAWLRGG